MKYSVKYFTCLPIAVLSWENNSVRHLRGSFVRQLTLRWTPAILPKSGKVDPRYERCLPRDGYRLLGQEEGRMVTADRGETMKL